MSQLKRLFQLASATVALSLCFNPTSVNALTLTVTGQQPLRTNGNELPFSTTVGILSVSGTLKSAIGNNVLVNELGAKVGGIVFTLTNFLAVNNSNTQRYSINNNFIIFENDYNTSTITDLNRSTIRGSQELTGTYRDNRGMSVDSSNKVVFKADVKKPVSSTNPLIMLETQSNLPINPQVQEPIEENDSERRSNPSEFTLRITAKLDQFVLAPREELRLDDSACIVISDGQDNINVSETCARVAAPEPSFAWSILALGALGTTSWFTRKRKFLPQNKD